jgi:ferrous iron transport protein B
VDSTRLESQLMLVDPVLALSIPTLLVLNMSDELAGRGGRVDAAALAEQLGVEVVRANARAGVGVDEVREFLGRVRRGEPVHDARPERKFAPARRVELPVVDVFVTRRGRMKVIGQNARYRAPVPSRITERLDSVFLHKWLGPLVFLVMGALVFQAIFAWATPLMDGIEYVITGSGEWVRARMADTWYRSLLIDGVWAGVGSVLVFLPQILVLFVFLGVLEDSGYMGTFSLRAQSESSRY